MDVSVNVSVLEFVSAVVDAIKLEDCVGGDHGARDAGQGADGARV